MTPVLHAAGRGAVAAMAMSGMRLFAKEAGVLTNSPPDAIARQRRVRGALKHVPRGRRRATLELLHWGYGAGGGAMYGVLPERVRRAPWSGPAYGIALWVGFELGLAPLLGLRRDKPVGVADRAVLVADHALYGLVLAEGHRRPRE